MSRFPQSNFFLCVQTPRQSLVRTQTSESLLLSMDFSAHVFVHIFHYYMRRRLRWCRRRGLWQFLFHYNRRWCCYSFHRSEMFQNVFLDLWWDLLLLHSFPPCCTLSIPNSSACGSWTVQSSIASSLDSWLEGDKGMNVRQREHVLVASWSHVRAQRFEFRGEHSDWRKSLLIKVLVFFFDWLVTFSTSERREESLRLWRLEGRLKPSLTVLLLW